MQQMTRAEQFAWRVQGVAYHEAAHAVGFAACDVEMSHAKIIHKGQDPSTVEGYVMVANDHQLNEVDPDDVVVAIFAGLTAHARWFHRVGGLERGYAVRYAEDCAIADQVMARRYLRKGTRSTTEARDAARSLVRDRWPEITRIAKKLATSMELTNREIYRLTR